MSRFFLGAALASDSNRVRRTASNLIAGSEMVALITIIYKEEPSLSNHKEITVTLDPKRMFFVKQCKNELATPSEAKSGQAGRAKLPTFTRKNFWGLPLAKTLPFDSVSTDLFKVGNNLSIPFFD